jgi:methionine-gamma-lyase
MNAGFHTRAIHEAETHLGGALVTPICQTATFKFKTLEEAKNAIELSLEREAPGYAYTRFSNPTHTALEKKVASLEEGQAALATASGMAAIATVIFTAMKKGDHLVSAGGIYTTTHSLFAKLTAWGMEVSFADQTRPADIASNIKRNTRLVFLETPSNPLLDVADIAEIAKIAEKQGARVVVDNTFLTPYYQRPLKMGADIVIHSATKYLSGHLDTMGGVIVGEKDFIMACADIVTLMGGILNPFNAWLITRGIKTLPIRMEKHSRNAMAVARWLENEPKVKMVRYPGLASHPQHQLGAKLMGGHGGMVAFEVTGGLEGARKLLETVGLCSLAVSLGGPETLLEHPATMSHLKMPPEDRAALGISDGLIRMSVGLEDAEDIIADLAAALRKL